MRPTARPLIRPSGTFSREGRRESVTENSMKETKQVPASPEARAAIAVALADVAGTGADAAP